MKISLKPLKKLPLFLLLVWGWEFSIMIILDNLPKLSDFIEALVDATSLILVCSYPAWVWVIKPLLGHSARKADLFERAISEFAIIGITDPKGVITYVNEKFCKISKYSREELIGKTHRVVKSGVHEKIFFKEMWDTISSGKVWRGQVCNRAKDGSLYWVEAVILPMFDSDGNIEAYYALRYDITQLKELTEKERQQSARMAQSTKMASLGEMAGGIAHEINNPLSVITGKAQLLQQMMEMNQLNPEKAVTHLQAINKTVDRISDIIRGLKNFSRNDGEGVPFRVVQLKEILEDTFNLCQARFMNHGVKLMMPEVREGLEVECRPTQISQVILNLLNNAHDAIGSLEEKWVMVSVTEIENDIEIRVTDSGSGIPEHVRMKIMEPFFTTKPVGKGTGLGLSVSLGILKAHRGSLVVDTESKNTCFVLRFPRLQPMKEENST